MRTISETLTGFADILKPEGDRYSEAPWGQTCCFLDSRDFARLCKFCTPEQVAEAIPGIWKEDVTFEDWGEVREFSEDNIKAQLIADATFGLEKAEGERGISSELMFYVCKLWLWVLEDELWQMDHDQQYGISLFKAVLDKYAPKIIVARS